MRQKITSLSRFIQKPTYVPLYATYVIEQVGVASAGIVGGTAVKEGAINVMGEVGVDISGYTSDAMADFDHERSARYALINSKFLNFICIFAFTHLPQSSTPPPTPPNTQHTSSYGTRTRTLSTDGRRFDMVISCCGCGDKLDGEKAVWKTRAVFEDWNLDGKYQGWS